MHDDVNVTRLAVVAIENDGQPADGGKINARRRDLGQQFFELGSNLLR